MHGSPSVSVQSARSIPDCMDTTALHDMGAIYATALSIVSAHGVTVDLWLTEWL